MCPKLENVASDIRVLFVIWSDPMMMNTDNTQAARMCVCLRNIRSKSSFSCCKRRVNAAYYILLSYR